MSTTLILKQSTKKSQRGTEESPFVKWTLTSLALAFCGVFLLLPLVNVFAQAFSKGWGYYFGALSHPDSVSAIKLTLLVAGISVPLNVAFGLAAAWAIAKFQFKGKPLLITLIDLPFSVSPVVAGLMFIVLFGLQGFFGKFLDAHNAKIIFAVPGIVLATVFITFPFVARELIPVMQATGMEQEEAAMTLGANGWQTFWHVTLPSLRGAILSGALLTFARAIGEFGSTIMVSGNLAGRTQTAPLYIFAKFNEGQIEAANAIAIVLALFSFLIFSVLFFARDWLDVD